MSGQRGGGHRCADRSAPRGRVHCRRAANPSRFAPVVPCVRQPRWPNCLGQSRATPGNVHASGDVLRSGPDGADPQPSGSSAHDQLVTLIRKSLVHGKPSYGNSKMPSQGETNDLKVDTVWFPGQLVSRSAGLADSADDDRTSPTDRYRTTTRWRGTDAGDIDLRAAAPMTRARRRWRGGFDSRAAPREAGVMVPAQPSQAAAGSPFKRLEFRK
jgi:hypothetical protein